MSATNTLETELLNYIFRGTALTTLSAATTPASLYVALHTADPGEAGSYAAETTYTNYARVAITRGTGQWTAPTDASGPMEVDNVAAITFAAPGSGPVTITHWSIGSASTAGTMLVSGALTNSRILNNGDAAPSFAIGELNIRLG